MLPFLKTNFVKLYDCYVKIIQNWIWLFTELDASKVIQTVNRIENIKLHWFLVKIFGINLFSHPWKLYHRTFLFIIFYLQVVGFILHCGFGHLSPYLIAIRHQTLVFRTHSTDSCHRFFVNQMQANPDIFCLLTNRYSRLENNI